MATGEKQTRWNRRAYVRCLAAGALAVSLTGCAIFRKDEDKDLDPQYQKERDEVKKLWNSEQRPRTIKEISRKVITLLRVENVALVTGLPGTGGKVEPSSQRDRLLELMRRKGVNNPNQVLDDAGTAMVIAQVVVPPAARKRDRLNVLVTLSKHAEASNLQSGWLLESELVEMSPLGGAIRESFGVALARGPLVTQSQITGDVSPEAQRRAMVVGGADLLINRTIELGIEEQFAHAVTMATVLPPINKRFTVFDGARQVGVAKPSTNKRIELTVPPRYRKDPDHFANVVQHIGVAESSEEQAKRIEQCRMQLLEPVTARNAAYQLEALGKDAIPMLAAGLDHPDKEVRFYSAHALGYLNEARAIPALKELASIEPAFRAMCLNALTIIENFHAGDALQELLHAPDIETRYGALLALRQYDRQLPLLQGEVVDKVGSILEVPTTGTPAVIVGLNNSPEIVILGPNPQITLSDGFLYANPRIMLRVVGPNLVSVSHLAPEQEDRIVESASDLRSLLQAIAQVGGGYGDWVNFVRLCGANKHLPYEVAMNPIPTAGRKYNRDGIDMESQSLEETDKLSQADIAPPAELKEDSDRSWVNPFSWFSK